MVITHIVLFQFKADVSAEVVKDVCLIYYSNRYYLNYMCTYIIL
jgi:hypothetical protein